jgi:mannose/fructose/N-acetylgalactosamine-specific phosphotransferase system component IIB
VSTTPGIALVRVDNRLVHGQVLEAWVPALAVQAILVADDEVAGNPLARAAMGLAIPRKLVFQVARVADVAAMLRPGGTGAPAPRTLLLVRDVRDAVALHEQGVALGHLNLGNVHFSFGREQVTPTVHLDAAEIEALRALAASGIEIEGRAVPAEVPIPFATIAARFRGASAPAARK